MTFSAGGFTLDVWESGYPTWCELSFRRGGETTDIRTLRKGDLQDLHYAVGRALERLAEMERDEARRKT